jgi:DNA-binding response OmpR family regulator
MHILIIEDEEQLCRSMAEGLRMDEWKEIVEKELANVTEEK